MNKLKNWIDKFLAYKNYTKVKLPLLQFFEKKEILYETKQK